MGSLSLPASTKGRDFVEIGGREESRSRGATPRRRRVRDSILIARSCNAARVLNWPALSLSIVAKAHRCSIFDLAEPDLACE